MSLLVDTLLRGVVAYVAVVVYVRVSGNRTLAKMRAFDFVMTIAIGSLLATTVLDQDVPLWQGLLALALLVGLQWTVAKTSVHSKTIRRLVTNDAVLLYHDGALDHGSLRRARVTPDEVESAARAAGHRGLESVEAVWLEVNGEMSVAPLRA